LVASDKPPIRDFAYGHCLFVVELLSLNLLNVCV